MRTLWYRNAGRTAYHKARTDWIRSGRAVCGADIRRAGFVADTVEQIARANKRACGHCKKRGDS